MAKRGQEVIDKGNPISVPVGDQTLGRMFDVLGNTIDEKGAVSDSSSVLPIHRQTLMAPAFDDCVLTTSSLMKL